jgi:hypothetical protein
MTTETSKISLKKSPSKQYIFKASEHSASNEAPSKSSVECTNSHSLSKSGNQPRASSGRRSHSRSRSSSRCRKRSLSKPRKKTVPSTPGPDLSDEKKIRGDDVMEKVAKAELNVRLAGCLDGDAKDIGARLLELIDSVQKSEAADSEEAKTSRQRSGNSDAAMHTGKSPQRVLRGDKSPVSKTPIQRTKSSMEIKRTTPRRAASATMQLMRSPLQQPRTPNAKKSMNDRTTRGLDVKRTVPSIELCDDKKAMWAAGDGFQKRMVLTRANSTREKKKYYAENAAPEDNPFSVPKKGGFNLPGASNESGVSEFGVVHSNVDASKAEADEFGSSHSCCSFLDGLESVYS